ncbi:MAG: hypothetical protein B6I37_08055 [Desulfobacteraceae bacterium 4572_35.2]|nr:MAG: hypothetical protein B6I37_08055 [Desulfobacteraceae bacterium 4572_35.2]
MKKRYINNEGGFVLITSLLMLVILTIIGISATNTTTVELQIAGNDRIAKQVFYNQEMALTTSLVNHSDWLTGPFASDSTISAYFPKPGTTATDSNGNGIDDSSEILDSSGEIVAIYKARKIVSPQSDIATWEDLDSFNNDAANHPANQIPVMSHTGKPPVGHGYGLLTFYVRRYAITAYSPRNDRNVILQQGVFRAFPK